MIAFRCLFTIAWNSTRFSPPLFAFYVRSDIPHMSVYRIGILSYWLLKLANKAPKHVNPVNLILDNSKAVPTLLQVINMSKYTILIHVFIYTGQSLLSRHILSMPICIFVIHYSVVRVWGYLDMLILSFSLCFHKTRSID